MTPLRKLGIAKLGIALSVGIFAVAAAGSAYAQANVAAGQEITNADAAIKLLQPLGSQNPVDLSKNGIDTSTDASTDTQVVWPGPIFNAEGGPLKIFNCTGQTIKVKTFNSNDSATLVAFQEKSIGNGSALGLKCATKSCKVKIGNGNVYSALSGAQVLLSGAKLQTTNSAAINSGCAVYVKPKSGPRTIEGEAVQAIGN
ncbi:hypothetical protein [Devosia sp.]|uniref:hypothetical protein n=1 Tax=Devosia sp. TaxID=1871048 RepID=UPI003BA98A7E